MSTPPARNEATANMPGPAEAGNTVARPVTALPEALSLAMPISLACGLPESWYWMVIVEFVEIVEPHTRPSC